MFTFEDKKAAKVQPKTAAKEAPRKANVVLVDCKRTKSRIETFEGTDADGNVVKRLHIVDSAAKSAKQRNTGMKAGTWLYRVMKAHDSIEDVVEYLTTVVQVLAGMAPRQVEAPSELEFITLDDVAATSAQGMQLRMLAKLGWPKNHVFKGMTADGSVYTGTARTKDAAKYTRYDSFEAAFEAAK